MGKTGRSRPSRSRPIQAWARCGLLVVVVVCLLLSHHAVPVQARLEQSSPVRRQAAANAHSHLRRHQGHIVDIHRAQQAKARSDPSIYNDDEDDTDVFLDRYMPSETLAEELRVTREAERARAARRAAHQRKVEQRAKEMEAAEAASAIAAPEYADSGRERQRLQSASAQSASSRSDRQQSGANGIASLGRPIEAARGVGRQASSQIRSMVHSALPQSGDGEWIDVNELAAVRRRSLTTRAMSLCKNAFWSSLAMARWTSRNMVWTPMTYVTALAQWGATTSWQTTVWTGERAFFGPARTVSAPFLYLIEGLLFLFVLIPARVTAVVVRELYPVYVFLGAALAVGTAMGIGAAIILYVGSFVLGDQSKFETTIYERGQFSRSMMAQYTDSISDEEGGSPTSARGLAVRSTRKKSGSMINDAIRESLQRDARSRAQGYRSASPLSSSFQEAGQQAFERVWQQGSAPQDQVDDSDEEDDYFGHSITHPYSNDGKGKGRATMPTISRRASHPLPTGSSDPSAPLSSASGYARSMPVGATGQGGWSSRGDSNSSTPLASPIHARTPIPSSPYGYPGSTTASRVTSLPHTSPVSRIGSDAIRSHHTRQRRGMQAPAQSV